MMLRYENLSQNTKVFQSMTGLRVKEFDELFEAVAPLYQAAEEQRLSRPNRKRGIGAGHPFVLGDRDHILLTVVWLRIYPTHEGVSVFVWE